MEEMPSPADGTSPPLLSPGTAAQPSSKGFTKKRLTVALRKRCCRHNNWDNVRVAKGLMTLRCRECQKQWRAAVDLVWGGLKCEAFGTDDGCEESELLCEKLHIHNRKLSLDDRVRQHGEDILNLLQPQEDTTDHDEPAADVTPSREDDWSDIVSADRENKTKPPEWTYMVYPRVTGQLLWNTAAHE
eukprot:TRINITY_DN15439_c0_g1_i1.p1 TRINITY_DN15439_c0_g1~~TRINITY_DN15439_c0_g1_i1.p1  ORF type:complete len:195 (+),score=45.79 TRINITY_DN15439_c0_g1_i1:27-587(+)